MAGMASAKRAATREVPSDADGREGFGGRPIPVQVQRMPSPDIAIRAKRKLTNRLIAAHDALRLRPHLTDDMVLIAGDGTPIQGADAVVAAFAAQFADSGFIDYLRTTEQVEVAADGARAAETGRWTGTWKGGVEMRGVYMAAWRENRGQWLLERELYVTLA
jgi:ketosteroid isomerase-like protein